MATRVQNVHDIHLLNEEQRHDAKGKKPRVAPHFFNDERTRTSAALALFSILVIIITVTEYKTANQERRTKNEKQHKPRSSVSVSVSVSVFGRTVSYRQQHYHNPICIVKAHSKTDFSSSEKSVLLYAFLISDNSDWR